jgi:hypothetical protein
MTTEPDEIDKTGLDSLDPANMPARSAEHFRRIIAAKEAMLDAKLDLRAAVVAAHEAGESWTVIGAALGTSRQAAHERFSKDT